MAVGTTRPTLSATWAAITDQANVWITHDGGPGVVEIAVASSAPAASASGRQFKWGDEPLHFVLASGEEVYARCTAPDPTLPIITVMQSAQFGTTTPLMLLALDKMFEAAGTTLTRPNNTTPYSAGDSISDNATAGSVTALVATVSDLADAPVALTHILLDTNDTGLAAGVPIEVEVFNSNPTSNSGVGAGDNAAYSNKRAGFIGRFQGVFQTFSDGGKAFCVPADGGGPIITKPASGALTLWYQFKALGGFTPSAGQTTIGAAIVGLQGRG